MGAENKRPFEGLQIRLPTGESKSEFAYIKLPGFRQSLNNDVKAIREAGENYKDACKILDRTIVDLTKVRGVEAGCQICQVNMRNNGFKPPYCSTLGRTEEANLISREAMSLPEWKKRLEELGAGCASELPGDAKKKRKFLGLF